MSPFLIVDGHFSYIHLNTHLIRIWFAKPIWLAYWIIVHIMHTLAISVFDSLSFISFKIHEVSELTSMKFLTIVAFSKMATVFVFTNVAEKLFPKKMIR